MSGKKILAEKNLMHKMKNYALILASGSGSRFESDLPKQFTKICQKTIFEMSVETFEKSSLIDNIVIVVNSDYFDLAQKIINNNGYKKISKLLKGGKTRQESSCIGVNAINEKEANVIIHDCVRPLLSDKNLADCIGALDKYNAVALGICMTDTLWETDEAGFIKNIPERKYYKMAQTPQCFKLSLIKKAHEMSAGKKDYTDDCSLVMANNLEKIYVLDGDINNIKITYPKDIYLARNLLSDNV